MTKNTVEERLRRFLRMEVLSQVSERTGIAIGSLSLFKNGKISFKKSKKNIEKLSEYMRENEQERRVMERKIPFLRVLLQQSKLSEVARATGIPTSTLKFFRGGHTDFRTNKDRIAKLDEYLVQCQANEFEKLKAETLFKHQVRDMRAFLNEQNITHVASTTGIPASSLQHFRKGSIMFNKKKKYLELLTDYKDKATDGGGYYSPAPCSIKKPRRVQLNLP